MNNIHLTKVNEIKKEIKDLIDELKQTNYTYIPKRHSNDPEDSTFIQLQNKYTFLSKTSKTLFLYIVRETNSQTFNKEAFDSKINELLRLITRIQNSEITQDDASKKVGVMLADEYIPKNLRSADA
jgi:hypothetical protein